MPSSFSLFIGCPTYGKADMLFAFDSVSDLTWHIGRHMPEIENVWMQRDVRTYRQAARQGIVESALQVGATHILMLDDDHTFTGKDFAKLWAAMQSDPSNVCLSALYYTRGLPTAPCMFKRTSRGTVPIMYYPNDAIIPVDVVGFGFVLFSVEVFKRINGPWFNLAMGFGEDAAFCERLLLTGFQPKVHTGVKIGHIHEQPKVIGEEDFLAWRAHRETQSNGDGTHQLMLAGLEQTNQRGGGARANVESSSPVPWWVPLARRCGALWGGSAGLLPAHRAPDPGAPENAPKAASEGTSLKE